MYTLEEEIKRDEGYRGEVYLDPLGFPTCGWGHHLYVGSKINETIAKEFLRMDIASAVNDFSRLPTRWRKKLDEARRRVIINMIFNMGLQKVLQFKKMWHAIEEENFEVAAAEMLDSRWSRQVKGRATRLAAQMKEGNNGTI